MYVLLKQFFWPFAIYFHERLHIKDVPTLIVSTLLPRTDCFYLSIMNLVVYIFTLSISLSLVSAINFLDTVYEWKYIDYLWTSESEKQEFIKNGDYNFSQILPMDVDKSIDGRVFLSIIGKPGVPARLVTVSNQTGPSGPLVKPYPDWSWFKKGDCDGITNVYKIAIDECNRLWILDTGYMENTNSECEAQLLSFDLDTDQLAKRIKIPNRFAKNAQNETLLASLIVDNEGSNCHNTTVYIADAIGRGLIIWNGVDFIRLESPSFIPDKVAEKVVVGDNILDLPLSIVGMDISPRLIEEEPRFLYLHALASYDLYMADTQELKRSINGSSVGFLGAQNAFTSQSPAMAFASDGTLFFGLTKEIAIGCWNRYKALNSDNVEIAAQDNERLQYNSGIKVILSVDNTEDEEVWALTNRFVAFQLHKLDFNDVNFRVLKSPVKRLVADTKCDLSKDLGLEE